MLFRVAQLIKESDYGLFLIVRPFLNKVMVQVRDDLNLCDAVPEIDIKLKNPIDLYVLSRDTDYQLNKI